MIVPISQAQRSAGGKGYALGELTRLGLPVPPGFVVSTDTYRAVTNEVTSVEDLVKALYTSRAAEAIAKAYQDLGEGPVAVRSSAAGEDGIKLSFAGQHDTYLNVEGVHNVLAAILKCWASLYGDRAVAYRKAHKVTVAEMAVVIQRMVPSEASGTMFTVDPLAIGDGSNLVIEAVWGLGESLVSGEVTPDRYLVHKDGRLREARVVLQEIERVDGTIQPVPADRENAQKLTRDQVLHLAQMGVDLEMAYGWPQDIEWAMHGGSIYIVQSRPITTLVPDVKAQKSTGVVLASGVSASNGVATGIGQEPKKGWKKGGVLIAVMTTPDHLSYMTSAAAIVTAKGGMTCHAAITARELGIPCVVGVGMEVLSSLVGKVLEVNGTAGVVVQGGKAPEPSESLETEEESTNTPEIAEIGVTELSIPGVPVDGVYETGSTVWAVYKGVAYPFGASSIDYKWLVQHINAGGTLNANSLPSDALLVELAPKSSSITAADFAMEEPVYTIPGGASSYVYLKITSYSEGPAEAKSLGAKYNAATKTWKLPTNKMPGKLTHLKIVKVE